MTWRHKPRGGRKKKSIDYGDDFAFPKGPSPREIRDGKQKKERGAKIATREVVFRRDPACIVPEDSRWPHSGPDEWAHLEEGKRARTRGRPAEERHTPRLSCRLCRGHHQKYDAGDMTPEFLTKEKADGPIAWRVGGELVGD